MPAAGSRGRALIPTGAELVIAAIDGTEAHGKTATVSAGQHVTLKLLVKFPNGAVADVSADANCHFTAGTPRGQFTSKAIWSAGPRDAGRTVTLSASYRSPMGRKRLGGTVTVTVRGTRRGRR